MVNPRGGCLRRAERIAQLGGVLLLVLGVLLLAAEFSLAGGLLVATAILAILLGGVFEVLARLRAGPGPDRQGGMLRNPGGRSEQKREDGGPSDC